MIAPLQNLTSPSQAAGSTVLHPGLASVYPFAFSSTPQSSDAAAYLSDPAVQKLVEFFDRKGLAAIKDEDAREQWYDDWIAYQGEHRLYATLLSPKQFSAPSSTGGQFDLLRLTRFLEVFAYHSPAHGYSLQVTFLGLFAILMGSNDALKHEAVTALEAGGLLAFGISEKAHGADLLGNEFALRESAPGQFVANGSKYYIGNANTASIIAILGRKEDPRSAGRVRRAPMVLFALRPKHSPGFQNARKIRTLGVRAADVGEFEVKDHPVPASDVIAEGRQAWDAVLGTVTLGKFFLGFGSIGICEHAFDEAAAHLSTRMLFGKPAIEMPHLRFMMAQAYARLTAMKLYAYRALDYVHSASAADRRYLLFTAVQKAKVSTEGVKVMALLSECVGAKGFESDTYMEMALRDAQLIPGLEGSTHINLSLAEQFIPRYFAQSDPAIAAPKSLLTGETPSQENPHLMEATTSAIHTIAFPRFLDAYRPLRSIPNIRIFARQAAAFRLFLRAGRFLRTAPTDLELAIPLARCAANIAYGQLIAEHALRLAIPPPILATIFHLLIEDLSTLALALAPSPRLKPASRILIRRVVTVPRTTQADWDAVSQRVPAR